MLESLCVPEQELISFRKKIKKQFGRSLRVSYLAGPGDVIGTFRHWIDGNHDPRLPIIAYSAMLYDVASIVDLNLQVITTYPTDKVEPIIEKCSFSISFTQVTRPSFAGAFSYFLSQKRYTKSISKSINEFNPDIVICSSDVPSTGWKRLSKNRRLILTMHNTFWNHTADGPWSDLRESDRFTSRIKARVMPILMSWRSRYVDGAVGTSIACSDQLNELTRGRLAPPSQIPQFYSDVGLNLRTTCRRIVYVGRLESNKGIFDLLNAFKKALVIRPEISLSFAGEGSSKDKLVREIKELNSHNVSYLGKLDGASVHALLQRSDLLVCPTRSEFAEGLAVVVPEAAVNGVPSLVSDNVPAAKLLPASTETFRTDDSEDLFGKLERLISDDQYFQSLAQATSKYRTLFFNREHSWGTQLFREIQRTLDQTT